MYNPYDHYFKKAKKEWYKARSAFKLEEIQDKFKLLDKKIKSIIDIGCAPGSWLQYTSWYLKKIGNHKFKMVWFDLKEVTTNVPNTRTYQQDITETEKVREILNENGIEKVDFIQSDMAPNTIWVKDVDAIRSFELIKSTMWIYKELLAEDGKFVVKVFMGPWFDEFVSDLKKTFGWKKIKVFKPESCRRESKETYVIKI